MPTAEQKSGAELVAQAINSFTKDPPQTDFQRGYLCALEWVRNHVIPAEQAALKTKAHP